MDMKVSHIINIQQKTSAPANITSRGHPHIPLRQMAPKAGLEQLQSLLPPPKSCGKVFTAAAAATAAARPAMMPRRPSLPGTGRDSQPTIAIRCALVSRTSCGTSSLLNRTSVPDVGATSTYDGGESSGAESRPPSVKIRRCPPCSGCQSSFK
eukprot:6179418-Pleurochrysis_carterae.AAC.2